MKKLGKTGTWIETGSTEGVIVTREDGKFFDVVMWTEGYDRPMIVQKGIGQISLVFHNGKVVVEDEVFPISADGKEKISQKRLPRASANNLAYSSLNLGEVVGRDYLDSQRIIYAEEPNRFTAGHNREIPTKAEVMIEDGVPRLTGKSTRLEAISLKEYAKSQDGPGKVAFANAVLHYLSDEELERLAREISARIDDDNSDN